ncbi:MAG: glycosyltransferase family 39 protein [Endomicrobia bacterium]|nr:glycosyltransferase family 39 protein [Endomicrobiia bacterium]
MKEKLNNFFNTIIESKNGLLMLAILVGGIAFFNWLGISGLSKDSVGYAEIAREMVLTGDYLTPQENFEPSFKTSKPPMLYWLEVAGGKIFGFNNFGVKFFVALLSLFGLTAFFLFMERYYDKYNAFIACIILTFTQQYLHHARSCVTDAPFAAFFIFTLLCFWIARAENRNAFYYLMGIFFGMAVMTRQMSAVFILFVIFAYIIFNREFKIFINPHFWAALFVGAAIFMPWHIAMYKIHGQKFLHDYFFATSHTITGYEGIMDVPSSMFEYANIILSNYWPWLILFVYGLYKQIKAFKSLKKVDYFFLLWVAVPFVIFHIAKAKQSHYLNPLYPAFAVIGVASFRDFSKEKMKTAVKVFMAIALIVCAVFIGFKLLPKTLDDQHLRYAMPAVPYLRQIDKNEKITIRNEDKFYFSSFLLFYAGKYSVALDDTPFAEALESAPAGKYFMLNKDAFAEDVLKKYADKFDKAYETKKIVLIRAK